MRRKLVAFYGMVLALLGVEALTFGRGSVWEKGRGQGESGEVLRVRRKAVPVTEIITPKSGVLLYTCSSGGSAGFWVSLFRGEDTKHLKARLYGLEGHLAYELQVATEEEKERSETRSIQDIFATPNTGARESEVNPGFRLSLQAGKDGEIESVIVRPDVENPLKCRKEGFNPHEAYAH